MDDTEIKELREQLDKDGIVVGKPLTVSEFGQLLKEMYVEDENGIPKWKKVFPDK